MDLWNKWTCGEDNTVPPIKQRQLQVVTAEDEDETETQPAVIPRPKLLASIRMLTKAQQKLILSLYDAGQGHIFSSMPTANPRHRRDLAAQLDELDEKCYGGLLGHLQKARTLLANAREGKNPLEGWKPSVPQGKLFTNPTSKEWQEMETLGCSRLGQVGFVLVAGGLGERLGYSGIKVSTR